MKDEISGRQVCLLALLSLLSPAVRVLPGDGPWYAPLLGLPAGLGYGFLLLRRGGPRGRLWPLLAALWLSLCAGFVVRDASERLTAAVYPDREAWGFVALTLLAALPLAAGKLTTLGRLGELSAPVLGLGLVIAGGFLLTEVKLSHLLPLPAAGAGELLRGGFKAAELGALPGVFLFLRRKEEAGFQKLYLATIFMLFLLFISISALTVGTLGSYLTGQLANPLLTAVRNIEVQGVLERLESLLVSLWIVADLLLVGSLLQVAGRLAQRAFPLARRSRLSLGALCVAALPALLVQADAAGLRFFAEKALPIGNALFLLSLLI